jgi:glycine oxidase
MNHYLVIGGGAIGMLTAIELCDAGHKVTLVERGDTGRESSWAGGGIISPLFPWRYLDAVTHLARWSQARYPALSQELFRHTGIDPEYTGNGMILVAPDEHADAARWAEQHSYTVEAIDADRFAQLEPEAHAPAAGALWMPDVGQVRNPRLVRALRARLEQLDATLLTGRTVTALRTIDSRCIGVRTDQGALDADAVIVCAGAWTGKLLGDLPSPPAVHPVRGQMLLFGCPPGTIARIVLEGSRYVIPRRDGRTLFGSTIEDTGFDKQTTQAARDELFDIATRRFPVLREHPVEAHWAGLRPSSPAGVPYIGPHPGISGLFVNAGQFRNGLVLGPASARLLADLVLQRDPIVDPAPYAWTAARG